MEIKVYVHRTKKHNFEVADCFSVFIDLSKLPEDKREDVKFINEGFSNDCQRIARTIDCIKKYGTGYVSFIRPQYEGPKEENDGIIYFDNKDMLFKKRRTRKKKVEDTNGEI